jgi:hypothetical protein
MGPHTLVWIKSKGSVSWVTNVVGYGDLKCFSKIEPSQMGRKYLKKINQ